MQTSGCMCTPLSSRQNCQQNVHTALATPPLLERLTATTSRTFALTSSKEARQSTKAIMKIHPKIHSSNLRTPTTSLGRLAIVCIQRGR